MPDWYVYMVRCRYGSLYTGIATDVERRFAEHQDNRGAKYLRGRGPLALVFKQRIGPKEQALKVEQNIKRLPRHAKKQLLQTGTGLEELIADPKP